MRKILFVYCLLFTVASQAKVKFTDAPSRIISDLNCSKEIKRVLSKWKTSSSWTKTPGDNVFSGTLISPTFTFGVWVKVNFLDNGETSIERLSEDTHLKINLDKKCKKESKLNTIPKKLAKAKLKFFRDSDLERFISKNKNGVIYTWSPHMPYSIKAINEIKEAVKSKKISLKILLSPNADYKFAVQQAEKYKIPKEYLQRYSSMELLLRGSSLHDPSILVFKNEKMARAARPGYEDKSLYNNFLERKFKQ